MKPKRFNIRVYGLLISDNKVLIAHENLDGFKFTKFPGGGLEFGEGILDCLQREFSEELKFTISNPELFYINDFFQASKFIETDQLISIYYTIHSDTTPVDYSVSETRSDGRPHSINFEWLEASQINPDRFTFPIDKVVAEKLKTKMLQLNLTDKGKISSE